MNTLEITLFTKTDKSWLVVLTWSGEQLPIRREAPLQLDLTELISQATPSGYGQLLGRAIFQDTLRDTFNQAFSRSDPTKPLRVWLTVIAEELKSLQWQRLCYPLDGKWRHLCLSQRVLFSLYTPSQSSTTFPPLGRRDMRALVLVANPDGLPEYGLQPFDASTITAEITTALGDIPHDVLPQPSMKALQQQLSQRHYTLLHWVSHGRVVKNNTILYLSDETNRAAPITAQEVIERLSDIQPLPYFIFLSACESATNNRDSEVVLSNFAQRLVYELGIPAVLGMADLISIDTARQLATALYHHLHADPTPRLYIDQLLATALAGLGQQSDITVPVLYQRLGARPLFDDSLDKALSPSDIKHGLAQLPALIATRAPICAPQFTPATDILARYDNIRPAALTGAAQQQIQGALQTLNHLCLELFDLSFHGLALGEPPPVYDARCPFLGLYAFDQTHREFFFGRETLSQSYVDRLGQTPFLAILGASGSGKSSLVKAGLAPRFPHTISLTPTHDPLAAWQQACAQLSPATSTLLILDQFEEVFTMCQQEATRQAFLQQLVSWLNGLTPASPYRLVLTMRADFLGECATYPDFKTLLLGHLELISPLTPSELYQVMAQQAAQVGLHFEANLSQTMLNEIEHEPGGMPLLQHLLQELWQRRHGRNLVGAEYEALGGVQQALAQTAEKVYHGLSAPQQQAMRQILTRLTRLDDESTIDGTYRDTRRRLPLAALVPTVAQTADYRQLVSELASARLVVTQENQVSHTAEVEVTHEALIRHWARLREWLLDNRAMLLARQEVEAQAMRWQAAPRDRQAEYLTYRGSRLLELQAWQGDFNHVAQDYVRACVALIEREEAEKEAMIAELQKALAKAEQQAKLARSRELAATANELVAKQDYHTALLLAIEAGRTAETLQAFSAIQQPQSYLGKPKFTVIHERSVIGACWNQDETYLLTWSEDRTVRMWNGQTGQKLYHCFHPRGVYGASLNHDGSRILTWSNDNTAHIWEVKTRTEQVHFSHEDIISGACWNKDGRRVLTWSDDKTARIWDGQTGEELSCFRHKHIVKGATWNQENSLLLTWCDDNAIHIWHVETEKELFTLAHDKNINKANWSHDEHHILTWCDDFIARMWDIKTKKDVFSINYATHNHAASWNHDESRVISWDFHHGTACVWDVKTQQELFRLYHKDIVYGASWNHDGSRILTWSGDKIVHVWDGQNGKTMFRLTCKDYVNGASWSKYGCHILTWGHDGIVRVWEQPTGPHLLRFTHDDIVRGAIWSRNENYLLTWSQDKTVRVWDVKKQQEKLCLPHPTSVKGASWNHDESCILTWSQDNIARVWDVETKMELLHLFHDERKWVNGARWNKDESRILTWSDDKTVRVWDRKTGEKLLCLTCNCSVIEANWNKDESCLLTCSCDDIVSIWDGQIGRKLFELTHYNKVNGASWNKDGSRLLTWSRDDTVCIWDGQTGEKLFHFAHKDIVNGASWNKDESCLLTWSMDKTARVWNIKRKKELFRLTHNARVTKASWNYDESHILTSSYSNGVHVWDGQTGQELFCLVDAIRANGASWTKDGSHILTWGNDKTVCVWPATMDGFITVACQHVAFNLTQAEWRQYMGDEPYRKTCENLPAGE